MKSTSDNPERDRALLAKIEELQQLLNQAMTETAERHWESHERYATAEYILRAVFHLLENPLVSYPLGVDYLKEKIGQALKPYGLVVRWERKPQDRKTAVTSGI